MQFRGLLAAAAVLALLGGGVWYSNRKQKEAEGKPAADAPPNILTIAADQLQQVEIDKAGQKTVLRRGDGGEYRLTAPQALLADPDAASGLFTALTSLNSERLVEEKAADLGGYGLRSPQMSIGITKKDGKVVKLLIGDETPTSGGFFARVDGDTRVFTLASWNKTSLDKSWQDLRDKRLVTSNMDKIGRIEVAAKGQTFEFGKNNNNEWQIVRPRPLRADGGQVDDLVRKLKDARMDANVSAEDVKKAGAAWGGASPAGVVTVTDAAGTQRLEVRKAKDNTYYAKSTAVEGVHKATTDLGDGLARGLDEYRNKKLFDFGWSDPGRVEIRDGDTTRAFAKSGEKWTSEGKEMDSTSVQSLIDKLRELAAAKFPEKGFAPPAALEVTVVSNEGKRTERVAVAKAGATWIAQRANEPALYEVEAKRVEEIQQAARDVKAPPPPAAKDGKKK